jgi:hypothetical protein
MNHNHTPDRIPFDSTVWELQSDSGSFINVKTGEKHEEDQFIFAGQGSEDEAQPEDWDLPQDDREGDDSQSGREWNDSQVRGPRRK